MKTNIVFLGMGLLGLMAWAAGQRHDVEAATVVNASPERVWEVLTDTAAYAEWNPVIVRLSGELRPGATVEFVNRGKDGREMTFRPRVLTAQPGRELRWLGQVGVPRLFDGEHYFRLTPLPGAKPACNTASTSGACWSPSCAAGCGGTSNPTTRR